MKKSIIYALLSALSVISISGCSMSAAPEATIAPVERPAAVVQILDDYALLAGHTLYESADGGYSIQLPEGSTIDDTDPNNITITIPGEYPSPDFLNITYSTNAQVIDTEAKLMDMLKDDNSIDITGFFVLKNTGAYEGYKYTYTAMSNTDLKGIKSTYFSADGSAYIVTATINNADEINATNINTVVDTFINNR